MNRNEGCTRLPDQNAGDINGGRGKTQLFLAWGYDEQWIKDIEVVYGCPGWSWKPDSCRWDQNTNGGFGAQVTYVRIKPVYTNNEEEAATSFQFFTSKSPTSGYKDLAKGAGGLYRYIKAIKESGKSMVYT